MARTDSGDDAQLATTMDDLARQLAAYRKEAQNAVRPRRQIVGVWAAVAVAWIAAGAVSAVTTLSLADQTAGTNDGKIAWVVFATFLAALVATILVVIRGD